MSSGFDFRGEMFWGSNGAIEEYIKVMADEAAARFGPDAPLSVFLQYERDARYTGMVVFLDEDLTDAVRRRQFLEMLDVASEQFLRGNVFTPSGCEWIRTVIADLRARIASADT